VPGGSSGVGNIENVNSRGYIAYMWLLYAFKFTNHVGNTDSI